MHKQTPARATRSFLSVVALTFATVHLNATAQAYPVKPIRIVIGNTTGGTTDLIGRIVSEGLKDRFDRAVIAENRPGAGALLAYEYVAKQPADGYTLIVAATSIATMPIINPNATYSPIRDYAPIAGVAIAPALVKVRASFPAQNLREFIAYAKANPEKVTVALSGNGGFDHLAGIKLAMLTDTKMQWVPYKGVAAAIPDIVAGRADVAFQQWGFSSQFVTSGKIRVLATLSSTRHPSLPNIPTAIEQGVPLEASAWFALFGPAGMPRQVIDTLNRETNAILQSQTGQDRLRGVFQEPLILSPEQLGSLVRKSAEEWAPVIKAAGVKIE